MKKIISIVIALVVFTGIVDAQITIKKSTIGKAEQVTTLSMYWTWIYKLDDSYFLVTKSDNEFDNYYWMLMGDNQEKCLESITSLNELCKTIGSTDRYEINNGLGDTLYVTQYDLFGVKGLTLHDDDHAGAGYLYEYIFNKAIKWIQKNVK